MKKDYCVYKHTLPDGKSYIGITRRCASQRWLNGKGYKNNVAFFNAVLHYGWANVKHDILFSDLSKDEASNVEKSLIKKFRTDEIGYGFNLQTGGTKGFTHNEATRKKISNASKAHWQDQEYRKKTCDAIKASQAREDVKKKKSEWAKKRYHEDAAYREKFLQSIKNYMNTDDAKRLHAEAIKRKWNEPGYKKKWKEKMSGAKNPRARAIKQYTMCGDFVACYATCKEASEKTGASRSGITACAKGNYETSGGYVWRYADEIKPSV